MITELTSQLITLIIASIRQYRVINNAITFRPPHITTYTICSISTQHISKLTKHTTGQSTTRLLFSLSIKTIVSSQDVVYIHLALLG